MRSLRISRGLSDDTYIQQAMYVAAIGIPALVHKSSKLTEEHHPFFNIYLHPSFFFNAYSHSSRLTDRPTNRQMNDHEFALEGAGGEFRRYHVDDYFITFFPLIALPAPPFPL